MGGEGILNNHNDSTVEPRKSQVFLRQATQLNDFKKGKLNFIFAGVGSGKTTYIGKKLPELLNYSGAFIFLAPYTSLKNQTIDSGLFDEEEESFRQALKGFTIFDDTTNLTIEDFADKKVCLTSQAFFWFAQANPQIWDNIGVLVLDEIDHLLYNLPIWGKNPKDPFKTIYETISQRMGKTYIIGLTATNIDRLKKDWKDKSNIIQFQEPLREIQLAAIYPYSNLHRSVEEILTSKNRGTVAIFIKRVSAATKLKDYFLNLGYSADLLVSNSATAYKMTEREKQIKRDIELTGKSNFGDILIFNATLERGVSILDTSFTHVFVHDSNLTTQIQVWGRFRFDGIHAYYFDKQFSAGLPYSKNTIAKLKLKTKSAPKSKNALSIPPQFINTKLTNKEKEELLHCLQLVDDRNRPLKWNTLSVLLHKHNYSVSKTTVTISNKRQTAHIIQLPT